MGANLRALTLIEPMRLTRTQLCDALARITCARDDYPDGSGER
jgi:hypothetical protein